MIDEPSYKRQNLVNHHRLLKGDMDITRDAAGYICEAHLPAPFLLDELYQRRIIAPDQHFYGVQFIAMRKLFLSPVGFKAGMLLVKRDEEAARDKPIPMEDTDYLRVLRKIRSNSHRDIIREVCDEEADPQLYYRYGAVGGSVGAALDALCEAINALWEKKKACADAGTVADY